jgi:hypothetical protein
MTANGQPGLETNGHQLAKAPPVDPSSKDDRLNEPRWIGRWPTGLATFPVDAHDGYQLVKAPPVDPSSKDDRLNEPRWIGRWPTGPATFTVNAHDGHQYRKNF